MVHGLSLLTRVIICRDRGQSLHFAVQTKRGNDEENLKQVCQTVKNGVENELVFQSRVWNQMVQHEKGEGKFRCDHEKNQVLLCEDSDVDEEPPLDQTRAQEENLKKKSEFVKTAQHCEPQQDEKSLDDHQEGGADLQGEGL